MFALPHPHVADVYIDLLVYANCSHIVHLCVRTNHFLQTEYRPAGGETSVLVSC